MSKCPTGYMLYKCSCINVCFTSEHFTHFQFMIIDQKDIKHEQLFIFTSLFLFLSILESLTSFLLCLLFRLVNLLNFRCIDFCKICRIPEKKYR